MLYKGTQQDYQNQIADHAEHEEVLRGEGWSDYVDLPESEPEMKYASGGMADGVDPIGSEAFVPVEQFDAVAAKLAQSESEVARLNGVIKNGMEENTGLRDQLAAAQGEQIAFKNDVGAMNARIAELQGDDTPVGATSEPVQVEQPIDYNSMTADQLRALLDEKGIAHKVRDTKAELIELLSNHHSGTNS